ncbi:MAG: FecR domain-containing protein [Gammaproteobacteria bacterium]|nr:FecR domain-containing protein [Gammaproteobacteria bacterium]
MKNLFKLLIFLFIFGLNPSVAFATEAYNADIRYLHVQKGQTLHNIVSRLYPERVKEWPKLKQDIVRLNPHAFINNDPTRMKAGVRLTLPKRVVVRSTPAQPVKLKKVGVVVEKEGSVVAVDQRKISRKLAKGDPVFLGDKVITGEKGYVRLKMIDEAVLDLRCFSIMVIEQYALTDTSRRSILNLLQGSLKKVTGKIGKMTEDIYELKTPLASIGVRGTEYALRVFQSKGCGGTLDADDGLYLEVIKGLVDVHNEAGKEVVAKGETAYVPLPKAEPKKVKIKPGVIKPVEKMEIEEADQSEEDSSSIWWWLLGIVAIALLI